MSKDKPDERMFLSTKDVQKKLGIGREKAYALMKISSFPSIRLGKTYFVTVDALENWLKQNEGHSVNL